MSRIAVILLLSLGLCGVAAAGPLPAPERRAEAMFGHWLAAFNASDRAALERLQKDFVEPEAIDDTLAFRDFTGGFDLLELRDAAPAPLVARVRQRGGMMAPMRLTMTLHDGEPARIAALAAEALDVERLDRDAALAGLAERAGTLAAADAFAGAWLVARDGAVLAQGAAGLADRAAGTPNTVDTRFRYGSAGKMFTAVAVLRLVEAGTLSLDGTVDDYLEGYPNADVGRVTLRQLLTHTGGTGGIDVFGPEFAENRRTLRTHADYLEHHAARGVAFPPGTKVDYSNYGFVLLGAILENATGLEYDAAIRREVFNPAGMAASGHEPESVPVPGRAVAYRKLDGAWVDAADTLPFRGMGAGGGYTTVGDLLRFANALQAGKLLSPAMLAQATSPQMDENWYGFGFITVGDGPLRRFGHGGDADGMNADFRVFPESGWVLVSLSNLDPPSAYELLRWFEPRMPLERAAGR